MDDVGYAVPARSMVAALLAAYRRERGRGGGVVGTDALLAASAAHLPGIRGLLAPVLADLRRTGSGPEPGPGLDTPAGGGVGPARSDPAGWETIFVVREVAWTVDRRLRPSRRATGPVGFSGPALWAVRQALLDAGTAGVGHAHPGHLMGALLTEPGWRAGILLRRYGVRPVGVHGWLEWHADLAGDGSPWQPVLDFLRTAGVIVGPQPVPVRLARAVAGPLIRARAGATLMISLLDLHARRQAVRLGHEQVTPVHLLLAALDVAEDLARSQVRPAPAYRGSTACGPLLQRSGLDHRRAVHLLAGRPVGPTAPRDDGSPGEAPAPGDPVPSRAPGDPLRSRAAGDPVPSGAAIAALMSAVDAAAVPGVCHVLDAVLRRPDGDVRWLADRCGVDPALLADALVAHLAQR